MKSILQADDYECYLCHTPFSDSVPRNKHHVFGASNRHFSEEDGMTVWLCPNCHTMGKNSVHNNSVVNRALKAHAQKIWEETYGTREDFMRRYGKNYIEGDET